MKNNKIVSAFMLIFTGELIYHIPLDSWSVKIMWIAAWIAILVGTIGLYKELQGIGRRAAGLWIAATLLGILSLPLEIAHSFMQGFSGIMKIGGGMTEPLQSLSFLQTWLEWGMSLGEMMYLVGTVMFMIYPPFARLKTGLIWLLVAVFMSLFQILPQFTFIPQFISFYLIITHLPNEERQQRRASALMFMAVGMMYSLMVLLNNDLKYILVSVLGLLFWLVGVSRMRALDYQRSGTGAFVWYGVLMFVASALHVLPGFIGDTLSLFFQFPAYIVLAVGFFRFANTNVFYGGESGMRTAGGMMAIAIILSFIYMTPLVGESISAVGICFLVIPALIVSWKNALVAQPEVTIEVSGELPALHIGAVLGRYKAMMVVVVCILVAGGVAYSVMARILPEKWLKEAQMLALEQGHIQKITDMEIPVIHDLVQKAAWLGNPEARMYEGINSLSDLKDIYAKAESGNSYAQYAIGFFLRFPVSVINKIKVAEREKDGESLLAGLMKEEEKESEKIVKWYSDHVTEEVEQGEVYGMKAYKQEDSEKAQFMWMLKAAEQGHKRALWLFGIGAYDRTDLLFESAQEEYSVAQYRLGYCYELGKGGVKSDNEFAFKWYLKAADNGFGPAQYEVGRAYRYEFLLLQKKDPEKALFYLKKALGNGYLLAGSELGRIYSEGGETEVNIKKAFRYFKEAEDEDGQNYCRAMWYEHGENGYACDTLQAVKLYFEKSGGFGMDRFDFSQDDTVKMAEVVGLLCPAAEQGYSLAQAMLGEIYSNTGRLEKAVPWLIKAAEQKEVKSMVRLGIYYYYNVGGEYNSEKKNEGVKLIKEAAEEKGDAFGQCVYAKMLYERKFFVESVKWFRKSAEQGLVYSQYMLGVCYRDGTGIARNRAQAKEWLTKARDNGNNAAAEALRNL